MHYQAWKKGIKSLYYCRSSSIQRADKVSHKVPEGSNELNVANSNDQDVANDENASLAIEPVQYEECLACQ